MHTQLVIRDMRASDFDAIMHIQAQCYVGDIPESRESLLAKWKASPRSCFVAQQGADVMAYLFAIPWKIDAPPQLNAAHCELPAVPDCMYLHDLAVRPESRGHQLGRRLFQQLTDILPAFELKSLCLVAVQGSSGFWANQGFTRESGSDALRQKLNTYGVEAVFMTRTVS